MQVICHQTMQDYPFGICGQEKVLNIIFVSQFVNIDSTILSWGKISFFFFLFYFLTPKNWVKIDTPVKIIFMTLQDFLFQ